METVTKKLAKMGLCLTFYSLYTYSVSYYPGFFDRFGPGYRIPACKVFRTQVQVKGSPGPNEDKTTKEKRLSLNKKKLPKEVVNLIVDFVCLKLTIHWLTLPD